MPIPLSDSALTPLIQAMEENLIGHFIFDRSQLPNAHLIDSPTLLLIDSGFHSDTFNIIFRANLPEDSARMHIKNAVSYFHTRNRDFAWWVGPSSRPLDLEMHLQACGLQKREHEYGMSMSLSQLPARPNAPAGLHIQRARTFQQLTDFADVISSNYEPRDEEVVKVCQSIVDILQPDDCPMQLFVGYLHNEPVATSELFFGGGVVGLYSVSTKQSFRKQGIGAVMSWETLTTARKANVETAILQASAEGRSVYAKLGFTEQCAYAVYK